MQAVLQLPTSKPFLPELDSVTQRLSELNAPYRLTYDSTLELSESVKRLSEDQHRALVTLEKIEEDWDYMLGLDEKFFRQNSKPNHYKAVRSALDFVNDSIDRYERVAYLYSDKKHLFISVRLILFYVTFRSRKNNKLLLAAAKRNKAKIEKLLAILDKVNYDAPSFLKEVSAEELWNNRCKAYDYLL